jgi:hypothetical protein
MGIILPSLLAGCHGTSNWWCVDNCSSIPSGAIPPPPGTHVRGWQEVHAQEAEADDFVIYKHEWLNDGVKLGPYGSYHIRDIIKRVSHVPFPVIVQADVRAELNEARRREVVNLLTKYGIADAAQRVRVDFSQAEGLYGEEAERIYNEMILTGEAGLYGGVGGRGRLGGLGRGAATLGGFRGGF